jgi:hypothetical protein
LPSTHISRSGLVRRLTRYRKLGLVDLTYPLTNYPNHLIERCVSMFDAKATLHKDLTCNSCGVTFDYVSFTGPVNMCDQCADKIIKDVLGLEPINRDTPEVTKWYSLYSRCPPKT